jgi:excisionase family DNA binding protein
VPELKQFVRVQEVADALGLSPWTIRHWIAARKIRSHRFGRSVRVAVEDVERLVSLGTVPAQAERTPHGQ